MTASVLDRLVAVPPHQLVGRVVEAVGLEVTVKGVTARIGELVRIDDRLLAQVIAVRESSIIVTPLGSIDGIASGAPVVAIGGAPQLGVGPDLTGRVIDGLGEPIDDAGPREITEYLSVDERPPNPLERQRIDEPLWLGVRAIDTMLTCGRGQRIGIFAGSGVGKSSLLGMIARGSSAEVVIVALIGERGREVREFLEDDLAEGKDNSIVVVATSDEPAAIRLRAAYTATRLAEWHAAQGKDVLLLMDSLTRVATAQREVGLTAGEPPTTRGYPPSVFAMLPKLLERAGPLPTGSITGIYTVLVEGDDLSEPIADHARSILDGHIVLSRRLASQGHFPTIDVLESASRLTGKVCSPEQLGSAGRLRQLLAAWEEGRDLVEVGAYQSGTVPALDRFLERRDQIDQFLRQDLAEQVGPEQCWAALEEVLTDV